MRLPRTSIAGLMGAVLVASLGLTAMRLGSAVWAGTTFLVTCGVLALAVVGVVCRGGAGRTWWLGFAIFGWGYLVLVFWGNTSAANWNLPTVPLLIWIIPKPPRPGGMGGGFGGAGLGGGFGFSNPVDAYSQAGHCLIALLVATLGGLTALGLFGAAPSVDRQPDEANPVDTPPRRWLRSPAFVVTAGLVVASGVALFGLGRVPGYTAAVVFFVTWCLLGLAVVGAVFGPRGRRAAWLGAALFGIGYMSFMFRHTDHPNWPHVATDRLLDAIRERFPWIIQEVPDPTDTAGSNARILKALDRPIPMRYPNETPLEEVLKAIQAATRGPDDRGIPIYIDPIGLQEAEKTMQSPIQIDLEDVPLRSSLRLTLRQLGLTYHVGGGLLTITYGEDSDWSFFPRAQEDPFLVVGHCLLALLAAGVGGMLAPRIGKA